MKKLILTLFFISLLTFVFAEVEYWPEAEAYLAKYENKYLKTYEGSKAVFKCNGFEAANHYETKEEAEKLIKLYEEQRAKSREHNLLTNK